MSLLAQVKEIWNRLPMTGRVATVGAAVATLALIGAIVYYGSQPDYGVLFSDLKPEDAQKIVEKLKAANVPYQLASGGTTVQVPHERVTELRLQMASEGAISGGHVGFDLFDRTNFGATDFAQQVNYRRAIEGELAKTLEGMDEVESARVHITPKKESVFSEKEESAKASVMLRVRQGKELSDERTDAIVSLIASSVEGLEQSNVSVMDTRGRLLSSGRSKSGGALDASIFHAQLEAKQKYEAETAGRIIALLEPVVGENRVKADVAADVDFSQVEQTEEKFDPQSQVVRSQQTTQELRNQPAGARGNVVGARANDPTATPTPAPPVQAAPSADQRSNQTTNYEISKTTRRTIGGGGRLNRMTVSVVVDYKNVNGVEAVRSAEEVKQIQDLVAAAVGTDQNRGDSVVVQTMAFNKPPEEAAAAADWLEKYKQLIAQIIKYGSLVLVALLVFLFIIRPARKALKAAAATPELGPGDPLLLPEATGAKHDEKSETDPHALEKRQTNEQKLLEEEKVPEIDGVMTVADLQARLDGEKAAKAKAAAAIEVSEKYSEEFIRADKIKQEIIDHSLHQTEVVVSTLRSWLREG